MSLISYIERIRTKSESERKRIALGVACVVTVVILGFWLVTTIARLSSVTDGDESPSVSADGAFDDVRARWGALVESLSDIMSPSATEPVDTTEGEPVFDAMEGILFEEVPPIDPADTSL